MMWIRTVTKSAQRLPLYSPDFEPQGDPELVDLLNKILQKDLSRRFTIKDIWVCAVVKQSPAMPL